MERLLAFTLVQERQALQRLLKALSWLSWLSWPSLYSVLASKLGLKEADDVFSSATPSLSPRRLVSHPSASGGNSRWSRQCGCPAEARPRKRQTTLYLPLSLPTSPNQHVTSYDWFVRSIASDYSWTYDITNRWALLKYMIRNLPSKCLRSHKAAVLPLLQLGDMDIPTCIMVKYIGRSLSLAKHIEQAKKEVFEKAESLLGGSQHKGSQLSQALPSC